MSANRFAPCPLTPASIRAALGRALLVVASRWLRRRRCAKPAASDRTRDLSRLSLPSVGLRARDIAVVVNDADPASVEIGRYYAAQARHRRRPRHPCPLSRHAGDGLRRLHARQGGARRQARPRGAGAGPRVDAAVSRRVHVGHGGVRARLRSGVVLRRRLPARRSPRRTSTARAMRRSPTTACARRCCSPPSTSRAPSG